MSELAGRPLAEHVSAVHAEASGRDVRSAPFELDRGWLAGRTVDVSWSALDKPIAPWAEYEGERYELHPVDPERNASRKRPPRLDAPSPKPRKPVDFDPPKALLDRALGRTPTAESPHDE